LRFWLAALLTGAGAGVSAAVLTRVLEFVEFHVWPRSDAVGLLGAAAQASPWRHVIVLLGAGVLTGVGQILLVRLSSGNGIDITQAIWFTAGRLPAVRTLGSAFLSILVVAMGASLGREGAPKQAAAVLANALSDRATLSDEQRRLLVACAAGAGMSAAYGVPLGGALFAMEVMRGALALRMVLPALTTSLVAAAVSWTVLPDAPTYRIPVFVDSASVTVWALLAGPIAGLASIGYVRAIAWADRSKPTGWQRCVAPVGVLGALGVVSIWFPQILGNGRDITQVVLIDGVAPATLCALLLFKPAATILCIRSGTPGGLFTPSLSAGALLGAVLGYAWSWVWPGVPPGLFALIGAGSVLAATTQGPISSVVLLMELTGRDRAFVVPLLVAVVTATLVARTVEQRSIYEARLDDAQIRARHEARDRVPTSP
jgi:H+/Cl- antiporter ClcA